MFLSQSNSRNSLGKYAEDFHTHFGKGKPEKTACALRGEVDTVKPCFPYGSSFYTFFSGSAQPWPVSKLPSPPPLKETPAGDCWWWDIWEQHLLRSRVCCAYASYLRMRKRWRGFAIPKTVNRLKKTAAASGGCPVQRLLYPSGYRCC